MSTTYTPFEAESVATFRKVRAEFSSYDGALFITTFDKDGTSMTAQVQISPQDAERMGVYLTTRGRVNA